MEEEEEPFDFTSVKPGYCWAPPHDEPKYGFTVDELLGCLSDMATRDTQRCTTAVEHLFMICPCFLPPPVPPVDDHRPESDKQEEALESLKRLSGFIRESRLRRAGNGGKETAVKPVDGEGAADDASSTVTRQDDKIQAETALS